MLGANCDHPRQFIPGCRAPLQCARCSEVATLIIPEITKGHRFRVVTYGKVILGGRWMWAPEKPRA